MENSAVHSNGTTILAERGTFIVGMSPGNSYFNEARVHEILSWATTHSDDVRVMIPDLPSVYTLRARGERKPEQKARLNGNNLANKCKRAIEQIAARGMHAHINLIHWSEDIERNESYKASLQQITELYAENAIFRTDVRNTTRCVLESHCTESGIEAAITEGSKYLLCELAFLQASPAVLRVSRAAYVYHRNWPVFENLINGTYDGKARMNIGTIETFSQKE